MKQLNTIDQTAYPLRLFAWLQVGLAALGFLSPFVLIGLTVPYAALVHHTNRGGGK